MKDTDVTRYIGIGYHVDTANLLNRLRDYMESMYMEYDESRIVNALFKESSTPDSIFIEIRKYILESADFIIESHGITIDPDAPLFVVTGIVESLLLANNYNGSVFDDQELEAVSKLATVISEVATWPEGQEMVPERIEPYLYTVADSLVQSMAGLQLQESLEIIAPSKVDSEVLRLFVDTFNAGIIDEIAFQIGVEFSLPPKHYLTLAEPMLEGLSAVAIATTFIGIQLMAGTLRNQVNQRAVDAAAVFYEQDPLLLSILNEMKDLPWEQLYG